MLSILSHVLKSNNKLIEKANKLIESLPIEKNRNATKYLDYAKENGIKTSDKNSIGRKILQCHLMKYGISNMWYKAAEKHGVNTKEELYNVYFNQLIDMLRAEEEAKEEIKTPLKMDLQALASNKKELKPIFNSNIEGHEEYQKEQLKIYNSNTLKFTHKRINNKMIEEYTKYFIYKNNTFMSVKPGKNYPSGYYDHVRKYDYKIDHVNKVILFTDKEIEEVELIKNNLGGENMNINKERYFKSMNPGHKNFIIINGDKATIKHLEGSKVWEVKERDIIKDLGHKNENAYIKHLKKFNYVEVKEPIKKEFYSNNKEVEPVAPAEQEKESLKIIYNALESKINNYIELVNDIEYFNNLIDGIVIYFPNGEVYQIFIDMDNKVNNNNNFIVLDENINILYNSNDINYIIDNVIKSAQEKNDYINNSNEYIQI